MNVELAKMADDIRADIKLLQSAHGSFTIFDPSSEAHKLCQTLDTIRREIRKNQ